MKNIKGFDQYVNEDYRINEEELFGIGKKKTVEDWWNKTMDTQTGTEHYKNKEFVDIMVKRGRADELTPEMKSKIESQAEADKFRGEIAWNKNKKEWFYVPSSRISLGSYSTSPPGATGTMTK